MRSRGRVIGAYRGTPVVDTRRRVRAEPVIGLAAWRCVFDDACLGYERVVREDVFCSRCELIITRVLHRCLKVGRWLHFRDCHVLNR